MIFNIQRWSLHDGPGIRTTVFFKGCPLRCRWCANPESWSFQRQLLFLAERCTGCGACIAACPEQANRMDGGKALLDREKCTGCGRCEGSCLAGAREVAGREVSVGQLVEELQRDAVFFRGSGGGVTFSGGEPFARPQLLERLARACVSAGMRTAVESCGFFPLEEVRGIFDWIDDIFMDLKHTDDGVHRELTGAGNRRILENILALDGAGRRLTLRVPLVEGITDDPGNIDGVIGLCRSLKNLAGVELLPYHNLGAGKYAALGLPYASSMGAPSSEKLSAIAGRMRSCGIAVVNRAGDSWRL